MAVKNKLSDVRDHLFAVIENGSLGAPKYRRSMVADPKQGHINEIGDIFDGILNGLK